MRILLDECVDARLRLFMPGYYVASVRFMGWSSIKNGKLLKLAEDFGFDILLTVDKTLPYEQNVANQKLSVIVFDAATIKLRDLVLCLPAFAEVCQRFEYGQVYVIKQPI